MKHFNHFLLLFFFLLTGQLFAQKGYVLGKVLDVATKQGVNLATITNLKTRDMTRTNKYGVFFLDASVGDSIEIASLTHERGAFRWNGDAEELTFMLKKLDKAIELPEVRVTSKREQELQKEIARVVAEPEARKNLSFGEAIKMAQSPISLLYELFSKSAKEDRKVAMLMQEKRRRDLANYRFAMIAGQATELSGERLERFRYYCNFSEEFLLLSSDYELTYEVLQHWYSFKRFKK
ncbi:hypothetical protein [Runella salmonicolor]|uniref:Carboxypeptidase-like regulatory domain-containing protein n=1 Tax=Runella salmonicolor TaxID=2950278 RepID=A0ABT1FJN4_9BACT|nr:hypothetical protein [Runella salmonicolor]MCP1381927.1 hypothetical protein [Runella salmonicolor]